MLYDQMVKRKNLPDALIRICWYIFSVSFRCGIFFAGKSFKDKPFQKIFIIPKRFPINQTYFDPEKKEATKVYSNDVCPIADPYGTVEHVSVHNDTCFNIVSISRLDDREKEGYITFYNKLKYVFTNI